MRNFAQLKNEKILACIQGHFYPKQGWLLDYFDFLVLLKRNLVLTCLWFKANFSLQLQENLKGKFIAWFPSLTLKEITEVCFTEQVHEDAFFET